MRVLVTGGTGFVGSHAVEALRDAGHEIRVLARSAEKAERVFAMRGIPVPEIVFGDMADRGATERALEGVEAVVHAAASVELTSGRGEEVFAANVRGVENVVGRAVELGLDPVVYVSTVSVFVPAPSPMIDVDTPLASAETPYARSKIEGERFVRRLQECGAAVVTLYPGGVIGPDQPVLDSALKGIQGALEQVWPMTTGGLTLLDVRDLARIIVAVLRPGEGSKRLMVGGQFLTWPGLADLCDELTGRRCRRMVMPAPLLRALGWTLDRVKRVWSFDYPLTYDAAQFMTTMVPTDDRPTLEALGIEYRDLRRSLAESLAWMVRAGHLRPETAGMLAANQELSTRQASTS